MTIGHYRYESHDQGDTWNEIPNSNGEPWITFKIGGKYFRLEESGFALSSDGIDWQSIPVFDSVGNPVQIESLPSAYSNGRYFGVTGEGAVEVYGDGFPYSTHGKGFGTVMFAFGRLIAFGGGNISVSGIAPWAESSRLINLSSRAWAGTGEETLISGFVAVPNGEPALTISHLLLRGVGPGLEDLGVSGFAADPRIELFWDKDSVQANDDWDLMHGLENASAAVGAFPLESGSADAAMLGFPRIDGISTMHVKDDEGGIALVEAYRLPGADFEFVNLSARALASNGERTLIGGFVLEGETVRSLLIRAVGPDLISRGVANAMLDPVLEVYRGSELIASNRGWGSSEVMKQLFARAGASELEDGSEDAALATALGPGLYTVHAKSESGQSGVVLLELFDLGD